MGYTILAKQRKKFRKKSKTAEICLLKVAKALDECHKHNVQIKLKHGIIVSAYGYVLPLRKGWEVRMLLPSRYNDDYDD